MYVILGVYNGESHLSGATLCHAELDAVAEAPSPDAGLDEGAVAGEGSPTDPSDVGASVSGAPSIGHGRLSAAGFRNKCNLKDEGMKGCHGPPAHDRAVAAQVL